MHLNLFSRRDQKCLVHVKYVAMKLAEVHNGIRVVHYHIALINLKSSAMFEIGIRLDSYHCLVKVSLVKFPMSRSENWMLFREW